MSGAFTNVEWRGKYKHVYGMGGSCADNPKIAFE